MFGLESVEYVGSFQSGRVFRVDNPLNAVWRHIERMGTVDNLTRIAIQRGQNESVGRQACLRIQQAVEFRRAASDTTPLTRPLLLYYSALNLVRGILLALSGSVGRPSHGLQYQGGESLLDCGLRQTKEGTFNELLKLLGLKEFKTDEVVSLSSILSVIPETRGDFRLLHKGQSNVAWVEVKAAMDGTIRLVYNIHNLEEEDFEGNWISLLPWFENICEYEKPWTLRVKDKVQDYKEVENFCLKYLLHDLTLRQNAIWYDHVERGDVTLFPRLPAYLAMLFVLSNVSRYEPELLDVETRNPTDMAYFLNMILDCAERYVPQLVLEALSGTCMYFS